MPENKLQIILNTANSPRKFQNDIADVYLLILLSIHAKRAYMPIATGRATQKRKVKKPGQAQMTMMIISIAQSIIPIIANYLMLAPSLRACPSHPKKQIITMMNDISIRI